MGILRNAGNAAVVAVREEDVLNHFVSKAQPAD